MSCRTYDPCLDSKLNQIGSYAAAARSSAQNAAASAEQSEDFSQASAFSAGQSATSATNAANSASEANNYLTQVTNIFNDFDERYLGAKNAPPATDNQGNPLQEGALYWNSVSDTMYVWDGASWITATGFNETTPFLATGTTTNRDLQNRFADVVNVLDFGADPTGVVDSRQAIQDSWDAVKTSNGTLFFPSGTYRCDSALDFTVAYSSQNHYHAVVGDCATIDFSNTALTTGNMITFGSGAGLFEEKTRFVMQGLNLIGPSLGTITATSIPPHNLIGIFFNYAINLTLRDITVFNFYIGYKVDFCFPIVAESVVSDNCYVGLQLVADVTCSSWIGCSFKEGRYGVVIEPKATNKNIYGQTFIRPLLEGNFVGMVMSPLNGSGAGIWDINVIDPYLESVTYDGFRIGRAVNYNDATVTGADQTRNIYNLRITGGLWDGQWGTSGHQPVLFHAADSGSAPAGCLIDIPVQLSTASIGFTRKSQLNNRIDLFIGTASEITNQIQYQPKSTSLSITDGVVAPSTEFGWAQIYVDTADGDLKIKFGDGTIKTIVTDT